MTTITTIITIMMIIMIMMLIYLIVLKRSHLGTVDGSSTLTVSERLARRKSRKLRISPPSPPKLNFTATNMSNSSSSLSSTTTATATALPLLLPLPLFPPKNDVTLVDALTTEFDTNINIDKDYRMKQYLTDQNNKFDRLITKNLDIVLNGDITKDPNEKILQLIYENRLSIFNYVYKTGKINYQQDYPIYLISIPNQHRQQKLS